MSDTRFCVICRTSFIPETPEQWTCGTNCLSQLREMKVLEVPEELHPEDLGISEAEKARKELGCGKTFYSPQLADAISLVREEREALGAGPLIFPAGDSTPQECLQASQVLAELAGRVSGVEDSFILVHLAQGYLGRVADHLSGMLVELPDGGTR